jgi:hypothetical protein
VRKEGEEGRRFSRVKRGKMHIVARARDFRKYFAQNSASPELCPSQSIFPQMVNWLDLKTQEWAGSIGAVQPVSFVPKTKIDPPANILLVSTSVGGQKYALIFISL